MNRYIFPLFAVLLTTFPLTSNAFNPANIISDFEFTDAFSLGLNQIEQILEKGALADMELENWEGELSTAAEIIYEAATDHLISPKALLVMLQKEQSLVEDDDPSQDQLDWAMGYAVCDDCSKSDPAIQRWRGFGKQVNSAALQFTEGYLADIEETGTTLGTYGPGVPIEINGEIIIPENAATAALYAYTPHLHGNKNFANIWDNWFSLDYPTGSILKVLGESGIYVIEHGYKRPVHSWSAFLSRYNPDLIIEVPESEIENYPEGRSIDFPNYSLLQDEDGTIYLLDGDALRKIDSMTTFRSLGFMEDELVEIDNNDVELFDEGEPITAITSDPTGAILQLANGALFYVQDGLRHILLDAALLDMQFSHYTPQLVEAVQVEQYREGLPITIPDGYLVKSPGSPVVYVISDQEKRAIDSEAAFNSFGWSWSAIRTVSESLLARHDLGDPITALSDDVSVANF
jgi:hypothetical protein